jgi:hypothetical protein
VCCVILERLSDGIRKKFAFTTVQQLASGNFREDYTNLIEKAHALGYHVVQAQQSHAEPALLQFLQERTKTYNKVPFAIGCHRKTCPNCELLFKDTVTLPKDGGDKTEGDQTNYYTPPALVKVLKDLGVTRRDVSGNQESGRGIVSENDKLYYYIDINESWIYLDYEWKISRLQLPPKYSKKCA